MKTKSIIYFILILTFTLSGCREIEIKTIINQDGSFTRMITVNSDSTKIDKLNLPYPVDSSWSREVMMDTADSARLICVYTKHYKNDEELQAEIAMDDSWWKHIDRKVEVTKSFRFFYSYIRYQEIYKAANPISILDYKDYLNTQDMRWIAGEIPLTEKDSSAADKVEEKVEKYLEDALIEELFLSFENGIRRLDESPLQTVNLRMFEDSVRNYFLEWLSSPNEQYQLMTSIDMFAEWTGNEEILRLHDAEPSIFEDFNRKFIILDNVIGMEEYSIVVEMPGLITETNSYHLMNNQVKWKIKDHTIFFEDFEMYAESRVVNYWAFVVSGVVVLLLLVSLIIKLLK